MDLGRFGIWTTFRQFGADGAAEAARLVEELGYGTFWLGGSPRLTDTRALLEASDELTIATGIVNVWAYEPGDLAAEHAELTAAFPGRLLLGIGVGHPEATSEYAAPLTKMKTFLDGLDAAPAPVPRDERCLAALAPKMLALSAERAIGAIPYFTVVEHTAFAREQAGPDALIAPEMACVVDDDPQTAREKARDYARLYLGLTNYTSNLRRFGFTDDDIADGGSDRLIDAVVPHGTPEQIAAVAHAHLDAGADHVCVQLVGVRDIPRAEWTALAAALIA
jgi:probable F420-dependent oxidoreductase